jgi:hypothetical protein
LGGQAGSVKKNRINDLTQKERLEHNTDTLECPQNHCDHQTGALIMSSVEDAWVQLQDRGSIMYSNFITISRT